MNSNITVKPQVGHYIVSVVDRLGVRIHHVTKDKRCTCGGSPKRQCSHIRAVANYLNEGGRRAQEDKALAVREKDSGGPGTPTCPICGASVRSQDHDRWRCPRDSTHYWKWRGERNGSAIRRFFTRPHPAKQGVFYEHTIEQREAFVEQARQRMYADGYNPLS